MNIMITGTDGFVGDILMKYFEEKGHSVFGTVFVRDAKENEVRFDIRDEKEFKKLPKGKFDVVIHTVGVVSQAAPKKLMFQVNAEGTKRMLAWAKENGGGHFIQISSVSVYGLKTNGQNRSEAKTKRYDGMFAIPYMRSKAKAERYIEESGLGYTILRLPAILGKNDTVVSPAIVPRLQNGSFYFCGKADKLFSTLYVKNLPPIIEKVIEAGPLNDAFNCVDYHVPWREFVGEYAKVLNVEPGNKTASILSVLPRLNDKLWALIMTYSRFGGHYPYEKLKNRLGDYPIAYPLEEGIREAIQPFTR